MRKKIAPGPEAKKAFQPENSADTSTPRKVKNFQWAKLLKRVFQIDVGTCQDCNEDRIIAGAIQNSAEIERYLTHVGIWPTGPPRQTKVSEETTYLELITD